VIAQAIKTLWRKKFVIITLAILIAFLPMAMTNEATVLSKTILTAIGIDKKDDEYIVTVENMIFNFDPFGVPEREHTTAVASTIDEALAEISTNKGRKISFSHCSLVLLGSGLADTNLVNLLMPFLIKPQFSNGAILMWTENDIEKVFETSEEIGDVRSGKLQQIATFNKRTDGRVATSLEEFIRNSKSRDGIARLNIIEESDGDIINSNRVIELKFGVILD